MSLQLLDFLRVGEKLFDQLDEEGLRLQLHSRADVHDLKDLSLEIWLVLEEIRLRCFLQTGLQNIGLAHSDQVQRVREIHTLLRCELLEFLSEICN